MKKIGIISGFLLLIIALAACGNNNNNNLNDELPELKVDFQVPETADPGDTVHLEAKVTFDGEPVEEADEVLFEIWEYNHDDDGEKIETENEGDGVYSLDYTFEDDGVYEMYAHTTAEGQHTMPKKQIIVGDAEVPDDDEHEEAHFETEGFDLQFAEPEMVHVEDDTDLTSHIMLDEEPLEKLKVRYEIVADDNENNEDTEWVDTVEEKTGEYTGTYAFPESGSYEITVHVQDVDDLHEHATYKIDVE